ncbi:excalibur calcium-binding domain-containing protein [Nocardia otitidiscaviarum]|uniref:excalibur calcium-binding domain-containing protein n=1 Tax=Nocardia otitidiscaviarum TaxID=1823 RepID=UPI000A8E5847|nr:excalibur calcium-binding domain-containing protein [Nocardia otitidiscaviarum]
MNISITRWRGRTGAVAAGLLTTAALTLGAPIASADPITDLLCNAGSSQFCPAPQAQPAPEPQAPSTYYRNCDEVRRAGQAPLHRGDPGYAPHLDRDNDGIACERA